MRGYFRLYYTGRKMLLNYTCGAYCAPGKFRNIGIFYYINQKMN